MNLLSSSTCTSPNENITVVVSRSSFCMVPSLYQKIEKLPWQRRKGFQHLNANADVFELVLQFLMFGKVPETTYMTNRQAVELLKMIKPLDNMDALVEHVKIFQEAKQGKRNTASSIRRQLSSFGLKSKGVQEVSIQFDSNPTATVEKDLDLFSMTDTEMTPSVLTVDNMPNLQVADSTDSSEGFSDCFEPSVSSANSSLFTSTDASILASNPFDIYISKVSLKQVDVYNPAPEAYAVGPSPHLSLSLSPLSSSSSYHLSKSLRTAFQMMRGKGVSRTHAEWCASEYVL